MDEDKGSMLEQQQQQLEEEQAQLEAQQAEEQEKMRVQEKILKNKIKFICMNLAVGSRTFLKENEKQTLKKAKKFPNLKPDIKKVSSLLAANRAKTAAKTMSSSPVLYYVFIGALILIVVICAASAVGQAFSWLFPDKDGNTSDLSSATFGITGNDFYGGRLIYKDEDLATQKTIEDYVELVELGIEKANNTSLTNVTLTINIEMPDEEYSFDAFDETEFHSSYPVLYDTISEIANVVQKADNKQEVSATLVDTVGLIPYFGIVQVDENNNKIDDITEIIQEAIENNSTFEKTGEGTDADVQTAKDKISSELQTLYDNEKYAIRTERLFIKDYILEDDQMMQDIPKENYVSFIFMPKKNVTFSKFSFVVGNGNLDNFKISLSNNGKNIVLIKEIIDFSGVVSGNSSSYYASLLNEQSGVFTDIDVNNINALSEGLSLFDIVENEEIRQDVYLQKTTEDGVEFYTFKQNGVVVELENSEAFNFAEFETKWK